ncbi:hypothetical protein TVAG_184850 [Trichomonas vaginalis G3]|uniref:Right handed beta helix domain-containing protein n=1 Tax=Trichomonas vaginalis (strain ATCC PRA-98 / G3) TaxID=412133 RepID=A2D8D0_TRIV3|nr:hypothetical protein TVAGG3_0393970 [Trichomonas vaginalis G3]EAY23179.1 hypothetical protein TVAG_184850 [Trichomonas vaginalis G3]KAI5534194.1 hypothetical protein TVAGG3_0393970 [Trichomonas vaginalis G3]|eukprot:XP_001584165.1 hypothetical protein [Trichomonas vaginalis G3]
MNECNITQNRVTGDTGGYVTAGITSDSYITCVNVIENNQIALGFNHHSSSESYQSSIFKITSCNYLRNKSPDDIGNLIFGGSNVFMSYCCIRENEIPYIFYAYYCTIIFENSTTDSTTYFPYGGNSPIFKNTDISFENECPLLNIPTADFVESLKYKCRHPTPNNDENEEENENNAYVQNHVNFFFLFMSSKRFRSQT